MASMWDSAELKVYPSTGRCSGRQVPLGADEKPAVRRPSLLADDPEQVLRSMQHVACNMQHDTWDATNGMQRDTWHAK